MTDQVTVPFENAGSVEFKELVLINSSLQSISVLDYMSEFTLQEDIFSPVMHGKMLFIDSRNLIKEFNIIGEEYLYVKFNTPTSDIPIEKLFRIYSITDRQLVNDKATQTYIAHFVSVESIQNTINPIFRTFNGKVSDVVIDIFLEFLKTKRNPVKNNNEYQFVDNASEFFVVPTSNNVKFVSPGWTPFKCINWCASKSIPESGKACSFLFFETNKAFMFTNLETLFNVNNNVPESSIGTYVYNINALDKNKNTNKKLLNINDLKIMKNFNYIENYTNGYYGNRLLSLDFINKTVRNTDYKTPERYDDYIHSEGKNTQPFFAINTPLSTLSDISFNPIHPGLHTTKSAMGEHFDFQDNANEKMPEIHGNRKSNLIELNQLKLEIFVAGRTDIEVGRMLKIIYPDVSPKGTNDTASENEDSRYTGNYLITAITHKLNQQTHMMSMEVVKDGVREITKGS